MHERPVAFRQRRKHLWYPAGADGDLRELAEKTAHQFRRDVGFGDREKRFTAGRAIFNAYRDEVVLAGSAGADEAVDQVEAVAFERRVATAPRMREQERRRPAVGAAFRACARECECREKILQKVAPALKAVKDIERRERRAAVRQAALVEIDEIFTADIDVAKQGAQVRIYWGRAMQAV